MLRSQVALEIKVGEHDKHDGRGAADQKEGSLRCSALPLHGG